MRRWMICIMARHARALHIRQQMKRLFDVGGSKSSGPIASPALLLARFVLHTARVHFSFNALPR